MCHGIMLSPLKMHIINEKSRNAENKMRSSRISAHLPSIALPTILASVNVCNPKIEPKTTGGWFQSHPTGTVVHITPSRRDNRFRFRFISGIVLFVVFVVRYNVLLVSYSGAVDGPASSISTSWVVTSRLEPSSDESLSR